MRRFVASMTAAASGAAAMLAFAGVGSADTEQAPPSGDERAVSHSGNVVAADCKTLWPGTTAVEVEATITDSTYITITEIGDGVEIVGVVVKGGDGYNVYDADHESLPPWSQLHAPLAGASGGPAAISHWFVCGVTEQTTSTTATTSSTTATTSSTSGTTTSSTTTSSTTGSSSPTGEPSSSVTTTSIAAVPVVNDDDLASTGANVGWLVLLGGALLLAGAALLGFPHVRKALLRR